MTVTRIKRTARVRLHSQKVTRKVVQIYRWAISEFTNCGVYLLEEPLVNQRLVGNVTLQQPTTSRACHASRVH